MALRSIVTKGDPILGKKCRTVDVIDEKIITLLEDMRENYDSRKRCGYCGTADRHVKANLYLHAGSGKFQ